MEDIIRKLEREDPEEAGALKEMSAIEMENVSNKNSIKIRRK